MFVAASIVQLNCAHCAPYQCTCRGEARVFRVGGYWKGRIPPPPETRNSEPSINTRLPSIVWFFVFGSRGIKTYCYSGGAARNNHMKFLLKFHATKVILVRYQTSVVSPG